MTLSLYYIIDAKHKSNNNNCREKKRPSLSLFGCRIEFMYACVCVCVCVWCDLIIQKVLVLSFSSFRAAVEMEHRPFNCRRIDNVPKCFYFLFWVFLSPFFFKFLNNKRIPQQQPTVFRTRFKNFKKSPFSSMS